MEKGGFSIYKYLRNQGRKRCKTNVNFQFIVTFLYCFVQNGTIHEKKGSIYFCCCSILWKKNRAWLTIGMSTPLIFFSFFYISIFFWPNCFVLCLNELIVGLFCVLNQVVILKSQIRFVLANK